MKFLPRSLRRPLVAALLALPTVGQHNVLVVESGNPTGSQFGTVAAAVQAASDGDLILVRPGMYGPAFLSNKSVSLQGEGQPSLRFLDISGLAADQSVTVRGFDLHIGWGADSGLRVADCLGKVWVEDVELTYTSAQNLRLVNAADVVLVNVTAVSMVFGLPALEATRSRALVAGCHLAALPFANARGTGMKIRGSRVHLSGGRVAASPQTADPAIEVSGDAGDLTAKGVVLESAVEPVQVYGGMARLERGASPTLRLPSPVRVGEEIELEVRSAPGDVAFVFYVFERQSAFEEPGTFGIRVVPPADRTYLGIVPESGRISRTVVLPPLGGSAFQALYAQVVTLRPGEGLLAGAASVMFVLAPGF